MSRLGLGVVILAAFLCFPPAAIAQTRPLSRIALIGHDGVAVKSGPSADSRTLTTLEQQAQVRVLRVLRGWVHVQIWASVRGWIPQTDLSSRAPSPTTSTYRAPVTRRHTLEHGPVSLTAWADVLATTSLQASPGGLLLGSLTAGRAVHVRAWRQDVHGRIWYQVGTAWALGDGIRFQLRPETSPDRNPAIWHRVAGKGMWLTLGAVTSTPADVLVKAALQNGVTHLYVESAISPLGFHGKGSVSGLLDVAHQHHLAVVAWVYPYFDDLSDDVALTREVAAFRTGAGSRFDGIAVDLERNVQLWNVRAYSQLVRRYLGSQYLLVAVTYPPQSLTDVPFAEIGRQYNVIAPMDYWHQTRTRFGLDYAGLAYGASYAYRYATDSVATIRRAAGSIPIAPIGQTFDDFGRLEMGPYAPSGDEIYGFLQGCKHAAAIGASFFEWNSATSSEWQVIHDFRY